MYRDYIVCMQRRARTVYPPPPFVGSSPSSVWESWPLVNADLAPRAARCEKIAPGVAMFALVDPNLLLPGGEGVHGSGSASAARTRSAGGGV